MGKRIETKFGLIDETFLSFRSPRAIDDGPFESLRDALVAAADMLEICDKVAIVQCRDHKRLGWVEVVGGGVISIDARSAGALLREDESGDDGEAEAAK